MILDFDGVICDSIYECFLVAYNAYLRVEGQNVNKLLFTSSETLKRYFVRNRHFVRPAREYYILFKWYEMFHGKDLSLRRFKQLNAEYIDKCTKFSSIFYVVREEFRSKSKDKWLKLNQVYPGVIKGIYELSSFFKVYILTTKDRKSVKLILDNKGLTIKDEIIYSKENNSSKIDSAKVILRKNNCKPGNAWFVDDNIEYLDELSSLGINCCLARWGFISSGAIRKSVLKGYVVVNNFSKMVEYLKTEAS